jgi:hypothetical protein
MKQIFKLLMLVALLLMPFGMTAAPAAASGHAMAAMSHCPEQQSQPDAQAGLGACAMACSAALPAADPVASDCSAAVELPAHDLATLTMSSLHPQAETPPPRFS